MEDAAKIGFQADTSGLVKAKDALEDLVPAADKASKASEKIGRSTSKASDALLAEIKKMDANMARLIASVDRGFSSVSKSAGKIPPATKPATKALTDLELAARGIADVSRPMQQATASVKLLDSQLEKGVISADQYAAAIDRLEAAFLASGGAASQWSHVVGNGAQQAVVASQAVKKAAGNTQASVGNMFAQFNDIGVTAAMGMNPAIIALQQGTQVAQAFVGVGLGAAAKSIGSAFMALLSPVNLLAIGLTGLVAFGVQLVAGWITGGDEAKKLSEVVSDVNDSFDLYISFAQTATKRTSELSEEFGLFATDVKEFSAYMAEVALGQLFDNIGASIDPLSESFAQVKTDLEGVEMVKARMAGMDQQNAQALADQADIMKIYADGAEESAKAMGLTVAQAQQMLTVFDNLKQADTLPEMADAAFDALEVIKKIWPEGQKIPTALRPAVMAIEQFSRQSAKAVKAQNELAQETRTTANAMDYLPGAANALGSALQYAAGTGSNLANSIWDGDSAMTALLSGVPGAGWLSGAIADAIKLASNLWDAVTAKLSLGGSGLLDDAGNSVPNGVNPKLRPQSRPMDLGSKGGGGGGGGGASKQLTELEKLSEAFQKLSEPFDQAQSAVKLIDDALKNGIIGNDEYAKSLGRIEAAFTKAGGTAEQWEKVISGTTKSAAQQMKELQKSSIEGLGDAIADLAVDGSANFGDMAKSIVKSMIKIAVQAAIIEPLLKMFGLEKGGAVMTGGSSPSALALGGVVAGGKLQPFAKGGAFTNGIYDSPTLFKFAKGGAMGVMGEAGPEAVMPLKRAQDGSLGVQMTGAGQAAANKTTVVQQVINNADGTRAREEKEMGADGVEYQRVIIESVNEAWARGEFDDVSRARNGQQVVRTVR